MEDELDADYRSGEIYHLNTPLLTINTTRNTIYLHLPNWPIPADELQAFHDQAIGGLVEAEG